MKKLFTFRNLAKALMVGWFAHSTGLPHAALKVVSSAVAYAQKAEIERLAGEVDALEGKELAIEGEIKTVQSLVEIADPEVQSKLQRRVNHLEARKARLFVDKGDAIEQIDGLTEAQRRVIESRDVALNYVGDATEIALKLRDGDQRRLVELREELGLTEAALAELEIEQAQQAAELETERFEQLLNTSRLELQNEQERAERRQLEREILKRRSAKAEATLHSPALEADEFEAADITTSILWRLCKFPQPR